MQQSPREWSGSSYHQVPSKTKTKTDAYDQMLKFMTADQQSSSFKDLYQNDTVVHALCLIVGISPAIAMDDMSMWKGSGYEDAVTGTYQWLKALVCYISVIGLGHSICMKMGLGSTPAVCAPHFMKVVGRFAGRLFPFIATMLLTPILLAMTIAVRCSILVPVSSFTSKVCLALLTLVMCTLFVYFLAISIIATRSVYAKQENDISQERHTELANALRARVGDEFADKYFHRFASADIAAVHLSRLEKSDLLQLDVSIGDALTFMASGQKQ